MPHLRELVKLHENKPFAIIGVNTGDSETAYRKGLEEHGVTWISAYQGEQTPIAELFAVKGYPTYYLLDPEGRIVAKGHSSKELDQPIAALLAELERRQKE